MRSDEQSRPVLVKVYAANSSLSTVDRRVQRAIELIESSPAMPISTIARSVNLSASRFRHLFTAAVGTSPVQYAKRRRLDRARHLLNNSFLSLKEISALLGGIDASHLAREYKSRYGETPTQTRLARNAPLARAAVSDSR